MPLNMTKTEIATLLSGVVTPTALDEPCSGVAINSIELTKGSLFIALKGEKRHGHEFIADAFNQGATLALVEDEAYLNHPTYSDRIIYVKDTLEALWQLAKEMRSNFTGSVVSVVGSVGKTTTKDLLGSLAEHFLKCNRSQRSFNNNFGVPYTICNSDLDSELWVLELGMNHKGELAELSLLAKPDAVILTQIAAEHMEFFASMDEVADAEFESLAGLKDSGWLIYCADDHLAQSSLKRNQILYKKDKIKVATFGVEANATLSVSGFRHILDNILKSEFKVTHIGRAELIKSNLIGLHNAKNLGAAILALTLLKPNLSLGEIANGASRANPPPLRLNQFRREDNTLIINDTYNSSPAALKAAIEILLELKDGGHKSGVVIGDMLELGSDSERYHLEAMPYLEKLNPEFIITYGPISKCISDKAKALGLNASHADTIDQIKKLTTPKRVDVILYKASRGIGLDKGVLP